MSMSINANAPSTEETITLLIDKQTRLADLEAKGWIVEMNTGGNIYLRHSPSRAVFSIPCWVKQLRDLAATQAEEDLRGQICDLLGIKD